MKINLIGSEGFIGKAIQSQVKNIDLQLWSHTNPESDQYFDLLDQGSWLPLMKSSPETAILLSWPGLPNYNEIFHVSRNLPACIQLVEALIENGCQNIVIAGTCFEYGLQNGPLRENQMVDPINCYAIAKDALRRCIEIMCKKNNVRWVWARIFYPYGPGQNPNSLLPSLRRAIVQGKSEFNMSSGRQLRDFVSSEQLAGQLFKLSLNCSANGIYNCGSGVPKSIHEIVEDVIKVNKSTISIRRSFYPDRMDEPLAFWADMSKFNSLFPL